MSFCLASSNLLVAQSHGQAHVLDSLYQLARNHMQSRVIQDDSLRIHAEALLRLAEMYDDSEYLLHAKSLIARSYKDSDSTAFFTQTKEVAKEYAEAGNFVNASHNLLSLAFWFDSRPNPTKMRSHLDVANPYIEKISDDSTRHLLYTHVLFWYGKSHMQEDNYRAAATFGAELENYCELHKLEAARTLAFVLLGDTYHKMARYSAREDEYITKAMTYRESGLDLGERLRDQSITSIMRLRLSKSLVALQKHDEAIPHLLFAIDSMPYYSRKGRFQAFDQLIRIYLEKEDFATSEELIHRASTEYKEVDRPLHKGILAELAAQLYLRKWQIEPAREKALEAKEIFEGVGDPERNLAIAECLSEIYRKQGKWELAFAQNQIVSQLKEDRMDRMRLNQIESLKWEEQVRDLEYEQQLQRADLQRSRTIGLMIVILIVSLLVLSIYLIRNKNLHLQNAFGDLQSRLLLSQMNPHFTANVIANIQGFLLKENDRFAAAHYLSVFSRLMRRMLNHSRSTFISLEQELDSLDAYIALQDIRHSSKIQFQIDIETSLDPKQVAVPPFLLQPLVENSIMHGKIYDLQKGALEIKVSKMDDGILIELSDNGAGSRSLDHASEAHISHSGSIMESRMMVLSKMYKKPFSYSRQFGEQGALVTIAIPTLSLPAENVSTASTILSSESRNEIKSSLCLD